MRILILTCLGQNFEDLLLCNLSQSAVILNNIVQKVEKRIEMPLKFSRKKVFIVLSQTWELEKNF